MPTSNGNSPLLLDTHVWFWQQLDEQLSIESKNVIEEAALAGRLLLSAMSVWELAMLESKGRIQLKQPIEDWVATALETFGLTLVPLTPEICIASTRLPGDLNPDPADRILVATARVMGARLMTRDRNLLAYGKQQRLKIISA